MIRVLAILWIAFKIWMLWDCHKRHAPDFWYTVIIFVPLGGVAYLLLVKLKDVNLRNLQDVFKGPTSIHVLRRRYEASPSVANLIAWAQGLYDAGEYREAALRFETALKKDENDSAALHGLGLSALHAGEYDRGIDALKRLVEHDPGYLDYVAWPDLALAFIEAGKPNHAVELTRDLVGKTRRMEHRVLLGQVLQRSQRDAEAREVLEQALRDNEDAASYVRRQNRPWVREAEKLLRQIEQANRRFA